jgi:glycosyltransferase involved in cell wall biosynthesis
VVERVSVVITYYKNSRFIEAALASARAQTLTPHEIIVIDDASPPDEAEALDKAVAAVPASPPCRAVHLPRNGGVSVGRNVGVARATGTHIAFLDADDLWRPDKLELQMAFLRAHPDYRAVHCGIRVVNEGGREDLVHKQEVRFEELVNYPCPLFPSALLVEREALFECGLFNPTKRMCEDLDLCLRLAFQHPIGCVDEPLLIRQEQPTGSSRNLFSFYHEADRIFREFRYVFEDKEAAADTLVEVHSDFLLRTLYARDAKLFWYVFRRGIRRDVGPLRLLTRFASGLVRNRLRRVRHQSA